MPPLLDETTERFIESVVTIAIDKYHERKIDPLAKEMRELNTTVTQMSERVTIFLGKNGNDGLFQKNKESTQRQLNELREEFSQCQKEHDDAAAAQSVAQAADKGEFKGAWRTIATVGPMLGFFLMLAWELYKEFRHLPAALAR